MGETKRVSKPMKKSARRTQQNEEVAEIHHAPDLILGDSNEEDEDYHYCRVGDEEGGLRSVSQTSHHHGPHGVDAHHRELLELEYEEEILELSGYHHRPPSLVGHVNSAYTGGFLPFGDSASSVATASPPPLLPHLPPTASSAASTLVSGHQFSETTYYKLTAGTPQSTTSRGSRGSRGSNSSARRKASDATKEEIQDDDEEASLRELLMSLQQQVTVMSMNLSSKLDELQSDRHFETTVALSEIRTQLQELTKSVDSCHTEIGLVKTDMVAIKHELDAVQQVKEEIEELREYVDRLEEQSHRRKALLLRQGLTMFLSYAIFAAVLGMLQFGYNTGVINAPELNIENFMKDVYKDRFGEDIPEEKVKILYSIAVSIFAIGGMVGGFSGGTIANRFGRKGGLLLNNFLGIGGACLMGVTKMAHSYEILFLGRFIIGVNCGLNTSLVPMYISEIAPLNLRGGLGTVNQLAVTVGLLISQVLGVEQILGTNDGWPVLLGLAIFPAILQLILLPVCPESPRYLLITKQWEEEARRALRRLRASNQVEEDIEEMRAEERAQQTESAISMSELICSPTLRSPLVIGVVMQLSQQLSGINAVFYYSTGLFISSGLSDESAKFATIGIGCIMVCMTLVSIPLMDRTGRRTLHLYGLGGMFIMSIFITISFLIKEFFGYVQEMIDWMSYLSVVSILGFVVFFAVGPGSIPWMITAELFSQGPRPAAMSIAVLVNWMANFLVGILFPTMKTALENYTFLPFSVFLAIFWTFTYKKVPETKNKTFEEILALFRQGNGRGGLRESRLYGSMLNCVNALEQRMVQAEPGASIFDDKPLPDSSVYEPSSRELGQNAAPRPPVVPRAPCPLGGQAPHQSFHMPGV
ncbi:glucose transporter type 1 isoform X2 [Neocloeon triangulifer]|uniref:glucose transporter type 1 isoform X2 n=1 Tax=Neocloeon triangulifer TaxID=2078957 RepID=UPI00286F2AD8|nr:glucose transporter type 1 isoform X2 [Neocloeon triangulifer]